MEADFMEQQARYRNRTLLIVTVFLLSCCNHETTKWSTVSVINLDSAKIETQRGITYINNSPFSGKLFSLYANKDTQLVRTYKDGREHGEWKEFYPGNALKESRYFDNGKKEGSYTAFWGNGAQKLEYNFYKGEYEGACKEWLADGTPIKEMNYKNGYEDGVQKAWYDNGKIKSNYVIKNGRRYGLLGTKNCKNVSDRIFNNK